MYRAQGLSADDAGTVARILSANPKIALDTHARLELGVNPDAPGAAGASSRLLVRIVRCRRSFAPVPLVLHSGHDRCHRVDRYRRACGAGSRGGDRLVRRTQHCRDRSATTGGSSRGRGRHLRDWFAVGDLNQLTARLRLSALLAERLGRRCAAPVSQRSLSRVHQPASCLRKAPPSEFYCALERRGRPSCLLGHCRVHVCHSMRCPALGAAPLARNGMAFRVFQAVRGSIGSPGKVVVVVANGVVIVRAGASMLVCESRAYQEGTR